MINYIIDKPTIKKLAAALEKELDSIEVDTSGQFTEELLWSIYRLAEAPKGSKLICVHDEKVPDRLKVEEGYWTINGKAYYLAVPRT